jgi:hypothetical protein
VHFNNVEEEGEEEEDEVDDEGEDRAALDFAAQVNLAGPTFSECSVQAGPPWGAAAAGGCDAGVFSWLLPLLSPCSATLKVGLLKSPFQSDSITFSLGHDKT